MSYNVRFLEVLESCHMYGLWDNISSRLLPNVRCIEWHAHA